MLCVCPERNTSGATTIYPSTCREKVIGPGGGNGVPVGGGMSVGRTVSLGVGNGVSVGGGLVVSGAVALGEPPQAVAARSMDRSRIGKLSNLIFKTVLHRARL